MKSLMFLAALVAAAPAMAQVSVENAWARATPPGAKTGAGYLVIRNTSGTPERLLSVSSPSAERVETHITVKQGDISRMREVKGYDVPAKGALALRPGGSHLMFVNIKAPFKAGESIPAVLRFEKAGEVKVEFAVRPLGASTPGDAHEHMHMH